MVRTMAMAAAILVAAHGCGLNGVQFGPRTAYPILDLFAPPKVQQGVAFTIYADITEPCLSAVDLDVAVDRQAKAVDVAAWYFPAGKGATCTGIVTYQRLAASLVLRDLGSHQIRFPVTGGSRTATIEVVAATTPLPPWSPPPPANSPVSRDDQSR